MRFSAIAPDHMDLARALRAKCGLPAEPGDDAVVLAAVANFDGNPARRNARRPSSADVHHT